jgi:programmed cell death 6-interacting protein
MKYIGLLSSVMMRVPVSEDQVRIAFVWYDSFRSKKTQSFSIFYEQASCLFNLGVAFSNQAAAQVLVGDGLKVAAALFQRAAGVFESLKHDIESHPQAADDLRGDALGMFASLQLAQAQECFFLKAAESKMKPTILCKLSQQTADYFDTACLQMESASLKALVDGAWPIQLRLKSIMYAAQTQLLLAAAECEAKNFGKQVALLRAASAGLAVAVKRMLNKRAPPALLAAFEHLCNETNAARASAEHDNDVIYNDVVPDTLPVVEAKTMVKATPFSNTVEFRDTFADLVPFAVRAAASQYVDKRQALLAPLMSAVDEHNDLLKGTLASLNLPGSLDALDNPRGMPKALAQRANEVRNRNGVALLFQLQEQRDALAKRNGELLSDAVVTLDSEEERDRSQAGGRRTPSHALNSQLRQDAAKYASNMEHARKSDALIAKRFDDVQADLVQLSSVPEELERSLPSAARAQGQVDADAVRELRRVLAELDALLEKRRELRQQVVKLIETDDVTAKLVIGGVPETVFARELSKYDALLDSIRETFEEQQSLLQMLETQNNRFTQSRSNKSGGEREKVIQRLMVAGAAFAELEQSFEEGKKFHTSFEAILSPFKVKCEQFANARDIELLQITASSAAASAAPAYQGNVYPGQVPQQQQPVMQHAHQQPVYQQPYGQAQQSGMGMQSQPPPYTFAVQHPVYAPQAPMQQSATAIHVCATTTTTIWKLESTKWTLFWLKKKRSFWFLKNERGQQDCVGD